MLYQIRIVFKIIEMETVFAKTDMNNEASVNCLQNSPFVIQNMYSSEFSTIRRTLKFLNMM